MENVTRCQWLQTLNKMRWGLINTHCDVHIGGDWWWPNTVGQKPSDWAGGMEWLPEMWVEAGRVTCYLNLEGDIEEQLGWDGMWRSGEDSYTGLCTSLLSVPTIKLSALWEHGLLFSLLFLGYPVLTETQ